MTSSPDSIHSDQVVCVVPARNEATVIGGVIGSLVEEGYRVLCVDDGSTDGTGEIARRAGAMVLTHPVNLGQGASLESGFEAIRRGLVDARLVATFDADGQHSTMDLAKMVEEFNRDPALMVTLGSRFLDKATAVPRLKRTLLQLSAALARFTIGVKVSDRHNGLRMMRSEALASIRLKVPGYGHADEFLRAIRRHDLPFKEVPVHILYTDYSTSKGQPLINAFRILFDHLIGGQ